MSQSYTESAVAQAESQTEPGSLALSVADFEALEERIVRAVDLVKRERQGRTQAEERAGKAETHVAEQSAVIDQLKQEVRGLRAERDQVRKRVERLLERLDGLEL